MPLTVAEAADARTSGDATAAHGLDSHGPLGSLYRRLRGLGGCGRRQLVAARQMAATGPDARTHNRTGILPDNGHLRFDGRMADRHRKLHARHSSSLAQRGRRARRRRHRGRAMEMATRCAPVDRGSVCPAPCDRYHDRPIGMPVFRPSRPHLWHRHPLSVGGGPW